MTRLTTQIKQIMAEPTDCKTVTATVVGTLNDQNEIESYEVIKSTGNVGVDI